MLTESQRRYALQTRRLVHDGQVVSETGEVVGTRRKTRVFSLRWTALDSPLRSLGWLAPSLLLACGGEQHDASRFRDPPAHASADGGPPSARR